MTLVQLRHLIALADHGSYVRAAAAVHLTQPALSRSIQSLESELGQLLLDRIGKRIEFTPTGKEVLSEARHLVAQASDLTRRTQALAEGRTGLLRVGLGSGPGALLMNPLLVTVATQHPAWRLEIRRGGTLQLVEQLRSRSLDALVVDLRSMPSATDLQVDTPFELAGGFMVRPGHPLATCRSVSYAQLQDYPLASTPLSDDVATMLVDHYGAQAHPDAAVSLQCEEVSSLVQVALHSDAVVLTICAAAPGLKQLRMSPEFRGTARLGLVTLARRTEAATLAPLRALLRTHLTDKPGPDTGKPVSPRRRSPAR